MDFLQPIAKFLIIAGIIMVVLGAIILLGGKLGIGRLPGDILIKKGNFTFYFPLVTSILLSLLLTFIFSLFRR